MDNFRKFAKFLVYLIIGLMLAFVVCAVGLILQANKVASENARSVLILATTDGCANEDVISSVKSNAVDMYTNKYISIPDATIKSHGTATDGFLWVADTSGNSLYNATADSYTEHVQRGDIIKVSATVGVNFNLHMWFGAGEEQGGLRDFILPVTRDATGISCRFYKGED